MIHKPVLIKEVLQYLDIKPNETIIDATVGEAGHTLEILKKNGPEGRILGIDLDIEQVENSRKNTANDAKRAAFVHDSYANIKNIVAKEDITSVNGILIDLGMSSWQLERSTKGFSFMRDELLDMRYNLEQELTAEKIVNEYSQKDIEKIIKEYGEEKFARPIAKEIVKERSRQPIKSTFQLKTLIEKAIPTPFHRGGIHVATRTFQALRIAVNGELQSLETFLPDAIELLAPGGRLVVISFHSLEDRIVKHFFKDQEQLKKVTILTKKPVAGELEEIRQNPRARSAKLRAVIKV